jgi:hypothetical protein
LLSKTGLDVHCTAHFKLNAQVALESGGGIHGDGASSTSLQCELRSVDGSHCLENFVLTGGSKYLRDDASAPQMSEVNTMAGQFQALQANERREALRRERTRRRGPVNRFS